MHTCSWSHDHAQLQASPSGVPEDEDPMYWTSSWDKVPQQLSPAASRMDVQVDTSCSCPPVPPLPRPCSPVVRAHHLAHGLLRLTIPAVHAQHQGVRSASHAKPPGVHRSQLLRSLWPGVDVKAKQHSTQQKSNRAGLYSCRCMRVSRCCHAHLHLSFAAIEQCIS
jgi:hypothetical protein